MMTTQPCTWRGMPAYRLCGADLEVIIGSVGGHIYQILHPGDEQGPLWQPPWPACVPAQADAQWGEANVAPLLASICGWNLCCDRFGESAEDPRPLHGEAGVSPWQIQPQTNGCLLSVRLPLAQLQLQRLVQLDGTEVTVRTSVASCDGQAHEIEWCEHITLGDPFLAAVDILAGIDAVFPHPDPAAHAAPRQGAVLQAADDQAAILAMPQSGDAAVGDIYSGRVQNGFWQAVNAQLGKSLRCTWDANEFPWLCLWTEHYARKEAPWHGSTRARGMEVSTKPFPGVFQPAARFPAWQGRSTRCVVPADTAIHKTITLDYRAIPG